MTSTNGSGRGPLEGEILPPEPQGGRAVRMPAETPLGLGILGMARFEAIRRVIESRERTLRALETHIDAEADVDRALRRRALALNELRNVSTEMGELTELAQLKRTLEKVELQEKIQAVERRMSGAASAPNAKPSPKPSDQDVFMDALKNIPGVIAEARKVKEEILRAAVGGALSPEDQAIIDSIDAMVQEFIARAGEKAR